MDPAYFLYNYIKLSMVYPLILGNNHNKKIAETLAFSSISTISLIAADERSERPSNSVNENALQSFHSQYISNIRYRDYRLCSATVLSVFCICNVM